jgi:hypothetical protein
MPMCAALTILVLVTTTPSSPSAGNMQGLAGRALGFGEFMIDTGVAQVRVGQSQPAVASSGANYLVVWQDERASGSDIYGTRVGPAWEVLDPKGIAVCAALNAQSCPSAAFLDSVCLVVWKDRRSDNNGDVYATRVSRSGVVLDPADVVISDAQGVQESSKVAAGDTSWLVVWQDNRAGWKIRAARVGYSGTVLDPGGFLVGAADSSQTSPAVAYDGEDFLVVWQTAQYGPWTLRGARVTGAGQVLDPGGFPISGDISQDMEPVAPTVASAAGEFLVAWQNARAPRYVWAKRVSHDGIPDDVLLPLPEVGLPQRNPSLSACGSVYLSVWEEQHGSIWLVYGARVSAEGALLDTEAIRLDSAGSSQVALAAGTDRWFAAWADNRLDPNQTDIFGAAMDTTGAIAETSFRISGPTTFYCAQRAPAIASHDSGYIAVWESKAQIGGSGSNTSVCGARLDKDGRMIDTLAVSIASRSGVQSSPAVACGDSNTLVAWARASGVYATRLSYGGSILDPNWITLTPNGQAPAVASDGTDYLVVWRESYKIYGARVTQSGSVLDRIGIATWTVRDSVPSVAYGGGYYLVTWQMGDVVWGTLVRRDGTLVNPNGFCVSGTGHRAESPSVASNGFLYFAVWMDYRTTWWEIFGTRIDTAGRILDTAGITVSRWGDWPYNELDPCVSACGANFIALWEDDYDMAELRGAVVNASGERTDTLVFPQIPMNHPLAASAEGPDGRVLCLFSAIKDPNGNGRDTVPRIWGSFVSASGDLAEPHRQASGRGTFAACPNPFARMTCLRFGHELLAADAQVVICDAAGRGVRGLNMRGHSSVKWDGRDNRGLLLPRGVYFCTLRTGAAAPRLKLVKTD